jgi:hypothetical protein
MSSPILTIYPTRRPNVHDHTTNKSSTFFPTKMIYLYLILFLLVCSLLLLVVLIIIYLNYYFKLYFMFNSIIFETFVDAEKGVTGHSSSTAGTQRSTPGRDRAEQIPSSLWALEGHRTGWS